MGQPVLLVRGAGSGPLGLKLVVSGVVAADVGVYEEGDIVFGGGREGRGGRRTVI